jgi:hypothetical protein
MKFKTGSVWKRLSNMRFKTGNVWKPNS